MTEDAPRFQGTYDPAKIKVTIGPPMITDEWPTPREVFDAAALEILKPGAELYTFASLNAQTLAEPVYATGAPVKIWSAGARSVRAEEIPEAARMLADGWVCHVSGPIVVDAEDSLRVMQAPFIRVEPTNAAGRYLSHADGGRAVRCAHLRVDATQASCPAMGSLSFRATLRVLEGAWYRPVDGGRIAHARVDAGRYSSRAPTNRRRKRERAKARRRVRKQR